MAIAKKDIFVLFRSPPPDGSKADYGGWDGMIAWRRGTSKIEVMEVRNNIVLQIRYEVGPNKQDGCDAMIALGRWIKKSKYRMEQWLAVEQDFLVLERAYKNVWLRYRGSR